MQSNLSLLRLSLAAVWLLTALASWHFPHADSISMLDRIGLHGNGAMAALYAGIMLDTAMGLLTLLNLRTMQKLLWLAQGILILSYSIIILIFLPEYALHPFGMLSKNLPMLAILYVLWQQSGKTKGEYDV